jgi:hypothetical protein
MSSPIVAPTIPADHLSILACFFVRFSSCSTQGSIKRTRADDSSTDDGTAVYTTTTGWVENTITWANRPARGSSALDTIQELSSNTWVEYDVTAAVQGNGSYAFVLAALSDDGVDLSSREGSFPPQLLVTVGSGGPTATATATPTRTATSTAGPSSTPTRRRHEPPHRLPARARRRRPRRRSLVRQPPPPRRRPRQAVAHASRISPSSMAA